MSDSATSSKRRIAALAALIAGAAILSALPIILWRQFFHLLAGTVGAVAGLLSILRAVVAHGHKRVLWLLVAVAGLAVLGIALVEIAASAAWRLPLFAGLVAVFTIGARVALVGHVHGTTSHEPTRVKPKRPVLIINPKSGGGKAEKHALADKACDMGVEPIVMGPEHDLGQLTRDAVASGADAIGMAGGDGSQALVASICIEHDIPFICIAAGTRNHFALDLGLDGDNPPDGLRAFRGEERFIDYGIVNGRLFVNNVSLGLYARIVQEPGYREAKAKTAADLMPVMLGENADPFDLCFVGPDGESHESAHMLLISNNAYELTNAGDFGRRLRLDHGSLGVTHLALRDKPSLRGLIELAQAQRVKDYHGWQQWTCDTFRIESGDATVPAGIDGETVELTPPLEFEIKHRGLRVLVPEGTRPAAAPTPKLLERGSLMRLWNAALGRQETIEERR